MGFLVGQLMTDLVLGARGENTGDTAARQCASDKHSSDRDIPAHRALPSYASDGDTQFAPRKARTSFVLHIWVSRTLTLIRRICSGASRFRANAATMPDLIKIGRGRDQICARDHAAVARIWRRL